MGSEAVLLHLERLFTELDETLSVQRAVNPCGTCNACCRSEGRVAHGVSELELRYLEFRAGPQDDFRAYLVGRDARVCPHYGPDTGCRVYAWRPFSCRVFGHFSEEGSTLPPGCVYTAQTVRFRPVERLQALPGAAQLKQLQLELTVSQGRNSGHALPRRALTRHESLDLAMELACQGDAHGANRQLQIALEGAENSGYVLFNAGLIYALLGQAEPALQAFLGAAQDLPANADAHYYAATQAMFLGQGERARELAEKARQLAPEHAANLSLLGSLLRAEGRFAEARECLEGLTGPLERFFLGEVLVSLGEREQARECFAEAARHESLRAGAEAALQALERTLPADSPTP